MAIYGPAKDADLTAYTPGWQSAYLRGRKLSANTYYQVWADNDEGDSYFSKQVNGVWTRLGDGGSDGSGCFWTLEIIGTSIVGRYSNNSGSWTPYNVTDSSIQSAGDWETVNTTEDSFTILDPASIEIEGAQSGAQYELPMAVVITITGEEHSTITLNGQPYISGDLIEDSGEYELIVTATTSAGIETVKTIVFSIKLPEGHMTKKLSMLKLV